MQSVKSILATRGIASDSLAVDQMISVDLDSQAMLPLVLEKVGEQELSVAHYWKQNGDLMRDPEVVFDISSQDWIPVRFVRDPDTDEFDPAGIDAREFLEVWDRNLRRQGYVDDGENDWTK